MNFVEYSHRHADAIIKNDDFLNQKYQEFIGALKSITDEELIEDFSRRKSEHEARHTSFKSMTPSINELLKERIMNIPGWDWEVDIFNDESDLIGNTEWRLDFACENAFCVEVAFNHGEAIAWNLIKPVLSCELNHVNKAIQGQIGIYVCATDNMKIAGNIDSASGSYEKVLRYLPPMMNQLTVPMMIIGLEPFDTFKINNRKEIVRSDDYSIDDSIIGEKVVITKDEDYTTLKGKVIEIKQDDDEKLITIQKTANKTEELTERMIRFLEIE